MTVQLPVDVCLCYSPKELLDELVPAMRQIKEERESNGREQLPSIMIWGGIGIAKSISTRVATQIVYGEGAQCIDFRLATCEPTDLLGIPKIENGATIFCPPSKFPREGKGTIHADEVNLAPMAVQHAFYQLILDGKLGYYTMPKTFQIVCCGNEKEHRAGIFDMPAPLMNRFVHFKIVEPRKEFGNLGLWRESWTDWAVRHKIDNRIVTFLYQNPSKLYDFDPKKVERAFATPRAQEFFSMRIKGIKDLVKIEKAGRSTIGAKITNDFTAWLKIGQDFDVASYFRAPKSFDPKVHELDAQFFLTSAITDYIGAEYEKKSRDQDKLLDTFCLLMSKFPEEFQILMCRLVYGYHNVFVDLAKPDSPLGKYVTDRLFKLLYAKVG